MARIRKTASKSTDIAVIVVDQALTPALVTEPTPEQIAEALASIETHMETVITADAAGIVDHHTQLGSWMPVDNDEILDQMIGQLTIESAEPVALIDNDALNGIESDMPMNDVQDTVSGSEEIAGYIGAPETSEPVSDAPCEPSDESSEPVTLAGLVAAQPEGKIDHLVFSIKDQIDGREAYETDKSNETGLTNIFGTLKKVRTQMVTKRVAAILAACAVDPGFINRTLHDGSRYNVYALGKLSDIVYGVSGGAISNAINLAIIKSMFICEDKDIVFTKEIAKACCSKNIKIAGGVGAHLVRHTVSPSTAPTQASSTMQALVTLGVVAIAEGGSRNPVYKLTASPMTSKIKELVAA